MALVAVEMKSLMSEERLISEPHAHAIGIQICEITVVVNQILFRYELFHNSASSTVVKERVPDMDLISMAQKCYIIGSNMSIYVCCAGDGVVSTLLIKLGDGCTDTVFAPLDQSMSPCVRRHTAAQNICPFHHIETVEQ